MSEDEQGDIDVTSDEEGSLGGYRNGLNGDGHFDEDEDGFLNPDGQDELDKRAHHNALERKRRDHIKESFSSLRDSLPSIQGEKSSRAQILKQATEYIEKATSRNRKRAHDISEIKEENRRLLYEVNNLEKAASLRGIPTSTTSNPKHTAGKSGPGGGGAAAGHDATSSDSDAPPSAHVAKPRKKKLKT